MERVEEFQIDGKKFMYIDLSNIKTNEDFMKETELVKTEIEKHPEKSLYTITNVGYVRFDSDSKKLVSDYMSHNKPYVKSAVVTGFDGIKKAMINIIVKMSGRNNIYFAFSKEQAIEWLLKQD